MVAVGILFWVMLLAFGWAMGALVALVARAILGDTGTTIDLLAILLVVAGAGFAFERLWATATRS